MKPIYIIILIILSAGILGGLTNFFLVWNSELKVRESRMLLLKTLLMGLCASITVPLFLQVLPNTLMDISEGMPPKNYFVLAGLCVVAAYFSKRFLEDLYDKISTIERKTESIEKKAEEAKKAVEDVELQNQELDDIDDIAGEIIQKFNPEFQMDEIRKVTKAVLNTTYSYRTVPGIAEDTLGEDNRDRVRGILDLLLKAGYVELGKNKRGNDIWKGTYHQKTDT
jgi:hypothetical protein